VNITQKISCHKDRQQILWKGGKLHVFGNNLNKSKLSSWLNLEQDECSQCLISFDLDSFVFQFSRQWYRYWNIQKYNFVRSETWSLTLREEHTLRVSENRVLRKMFAPKREKVTVKWMRLHNEKFNGLYSSTKLSSLSNERIRCSMCHVSVRMCLHGFGEKTWRRETNEDVGSAGEYD